MKEDRDGDPGQGYSPVVGIPVTATLKDADGGISKLTWMGSGISGAERSMGKV